MIPVQDFLKGDLKVIFKVSGKTAQCDRVWMAFGACRICPLSVKMLSVPVQGIEHCQECPKETPWFHVLFPLGLNIVHLKSTVFTSNWSHFCHLSVYYNNPLIDR